MHQLGTSKQVRFEEMLSTIEDIADRFSLMFTHISLTSVKTAFKLVDKKNLILFIGKQFLPL